MLPAIPVMLKTAATSIAKQAAVDAASGALSSTAKNKLSKVTQPNSETRKLEHEFSKNFKELEEVNTSDGVLALQDSFNSKLESIVSTSDEQTSRLIDAVKDANKAKAESINSNIENLREDITVLSRNVEAVNSNIESVGQMTTLAAEASAQNIGTGSNFISDVVGSVKNVIQTILGGALLSITGIFNSISRKLNDTQSEEGGDKTGMSGLDIVGDEETKALKDKMNEFYDEMNAAERLNVANEKVYATRFYKSGLSSNADTLIKAFSNPEKALESYNKDKSSKEQIAISNNSEENFINLVKANRNLEEGDKGFIPFNETILNAKDEELKTYYSEYKMVDGSNSIEARKRKEDYEAKKSKFEEATEKSRQLNSEKIREKVIELLSINDNPGESVIKVLMTDKNGNEIKDKFANVVSYYSTDEGRKKNSYNLSEETLKLYEKLTPKLVKGLKDYIGEDSLSTNSEGRVTNSSPDDVYLKYVVGLGGDISNLPVIGTSQDEDVIKKASKLIFDGAVRLVNSEGKDDAESIGMSDYETYNDVMVRGVNKYDDIYLSPANEDIELTDEEKAIINQYNGFSSDSYEELMAKLSDIKQNVLDAAALNAQITLKTGEATSKAIENSGKNSQTFSSGGSKEMDD